MPHRYNRRSKTNPFLSGLAYILGVDQGGIIKYKLEHSMTRRGMIDHPHPPLKQEYLVSRSSAVWRQKWRDCCSRRCSNNVVNRAAVSPGIARKPPPLTSMICEDSAKDTKGEQHVSHERGVSSIVVRI